MEEKRKNGLHSIILIHSPRPTLKCKEKGFYADNLAFEHEEFINSPQSRNAGVVYQQLTESTEDINANNGQVSVITPALDRWFYWRATISGLLLTSIILLGYFWIHIHYINPYIMETFKEDKLPPIPSNFEYISSIDNDEYDFFKDEDPSSKWTVTYDLPPGINLISMSAKRMSEIKEITCPQQKFALVLELDSHDAFLAKNWLQQCGPNIAYFRFNGDYTTIDISQLIDYIPNARFLPMKASLEMLQGGEILSNPDFQKTMKSNEIITNLGIAGYITPEIIKELMEPEGVPNIEELTISGEEICKSLKNPRREDDSEEVCKEITTWQDLKKLSIIETGECVEMYDLIYSCWEMPKLEVLQVRKSTLNDVNANYISGVINRQRVIKVDFADNVCFEDTMLNYGFMCQPSE